MNDPLPGNLIFESLRDKGAIVLASNARTTAGVVEGIFKAAKALDSAVIFEIARSECNLDGGYTGQTPSRYSEEVRRAAESVDFDVWSLHADHVTVKKGTPEDVDETRKLLDAQMEAGFTSFAIDASYLFNIYGGNLREELAQNIDVTTELAKHLESNMGGKPFGLEVEVGEIGKKDEHGHVVTTPEEATIAVAKALRENDLDVRIAQHGITGTPRELISSVFPKGDIIKGNVATFWQNLVLDAYKVYQPELYRDIFDWTLETYRPKNPGKADNEVYGKNVKYAIGQFRERIDAVDEETVATIEALSYGEARTFIKAFGSRGTASTVRKAL
jgi:fructose-bisphosphate aldolase class II